MSKDIVYISGPISSRDIAEARAHFAKAEQHLKKLGCKTVNPLRLRLCVWLAQHGHYRTCLLLELIWLAYRCNCIYMLVGSKDSPGSRAEFTLAKALGKTVMYERRNEEMKK